MIRRRPGEAQEVDAQARVEQYTVTRAPSGGRPTGLPPARRPSPDTPSADGAVKSLRAPVVTELIPVDEEREEPRFTATVPATATYPDGSEPIDGYTVDLSRSGTCLRMPEPPRRGVHVDIVIGNDDETSVLWCQIVGHRRVSEGEGWLWHLRVVAADATWLDFVGRLAAGKNVVTLPLASAG